MPQEEGSETQISMQGVCEESIQDTHWGWSESSGTEQREMLNCQEVATKASVVPKTGMNLPKCPAQCKEAGWRAASGDSVTCGSLQRKAVPGESLS